MESGLYSRAYLQNQMAVHLVVGCRRIVYGEDEVTTGASNDLQQVASTARQMIARFGMSDKLRSVASDVPRAECSMVATLPLNMTSLRTRPQQSTRRSLNWLMSPARATKVLVDNRPVLDELAGYSLSETVMEELQDLLIKRDVRIAEYVDDLSDQHDSNVRMRLSHPCISRCCSWCVATPDQANRGSASFSLLNLCMQQA